MTNSMELLSALVVVPYLMFWGYLVARTRKERDNLENVVAVALIAVMALGFFGYWWWKVVQ